MKRFKLISTLMAVVLLGAAPMAKAMAGPVAKLVPVLNSPAENASGTATMHWEKMGGWYIDGWTGEKRRSVYYQSTVEFRFEGLPTNSYYVLKGIVRGGLLSPLATFSPDVDGSAGGSVVQNWRSQFTVAYYELWTAWIDADGYAYPVELVLSSQ